MTKLGRPPHSSPPTYYHYRRPVTLVQILARVPDVRERLLIWQDYVNYWNVDAHAPAIPANAPDAALCRLEVEYLRILAPYTLQHAREQWKGTNTNE